MTPLPEARHFHRAGIDATGRVYAWAGVVGAAAAEAPGVRERSLVFLDPDRGVWELGPAAPAFKSRVRVKVTTNQPGPPTWKDKDETYDLRNEYPPGVGANGRMYWFSRVGPIWFDSERRAWTQGEPPLRQQGYRIPSGEAVEGRWLSSVNRWNRQNSVTAAGPDGRLYLAGGVGQRQFSLPPEQPGSRGHEEVISLLDSLEIFDPATLTWSAGAPMLQPRQVFAGVFGADGRLYVFGGYGHTGRISRRPGEDDTGYAARREKMLGLDEALTSVEAYDPKTDSWTARAPLPEGRHDMGAALGADGRIYVVGGAERFSAPEPTDTVFVYDPSRDVWERGPSLNHARYHHAVVSDANGRLYAIGGTSGTRGGNGGPLASVEALETSPTKQGFDLPPVGARDHPEEPAWTVASPLH
jgi:hypothetical protein